MKEKKQKDEKSNFTLSKHSKKVFVCFRFCHLVVEIKNKTSKQNQYNGICRDRRRLNKTTEICSFSNSTAILPTFRFIYHKRFFVAEFNDPIKLNNRIIKVD